MKFTCGKDSLTEAVNIVQKAVSQKSTMPLLEGILMEAEEGILKLSSNDLEIAIEYIIDADVERIGSSVINSKTFGEIVRKIEGDEVFIDMNEYFIINIDSRYSHFELKSIDSSGFPKLIEIDEKNKINIKNEDLKKIIKQIIFAVSEDDNRPIFKGVFIEVEENTINFVATDGYKLALRKIKTQENDNIFSCIIPGKALNEIYKILQSINSEIMLYFSENQLMFKTDKCKLVSRLIEGNYLNYKIMIPKEFTLSLTVKTKEILNSIERSTIIMNDQLKNYLNFFIDDDKIIITANTENGSMREELTCETSGEKLDIRFNAKNLIETIKVIEEEEIKILFTTNVGPCSIISKKEEDYNYLVMPLKIKA